MYAGNVMKILASLGSFLVVIHEPYYFKGVFLAPPYLCSIGRTWRAFWYVRMKIGLSPPKLMCVCM